MARIKLFQEESHHDFMSRSSQRLSSEFEECFLGYFNPSLMA